MASLQIATHIDPFDSVLNSVLPVRSRNTIRRVAKRTILVKTHRSLVIRQRIKVGLALGPMRVKLNMRLPENRQARSLHIPLIAMLVRSLNFPDRKLTAYLVKGMDIVGTTEPTNTPEKREVKSSTNARGVKKG